MRRKPLENRLLSAAVILALAATAVLALTPACLALPYTWNDISIESPVGVYDLAYDGQRGVLYAASVDGGDTVFRNPDPTGGGDWESIGQPLNQGEIWRLALDVESNTLYAAGGHSEVFRCDPSQAAPTWTSLGGPGGYTFSCLLLDKDGNRLYAGDIISGAVWYRDNPGGTGDWTPLPAVSNVRCLAMGASGTLFAGGGEGTVYRLEGEPAAWVSTGGPVAGNNVFWMVMDTRRDILYANSWNDHAYMMANPSAPGVWVDLGVPVEGNGQYQMALDQANDLLYAGQSGHYFKKIDASAGGTAWLDLGAPGTGQQSYAAELGAGDNVLFCGMDWGGAFYADLPATTAVLPASGNAGSTNMLVVIQCANTDIQANPRALFSGDGITVNSTARDSATQVTASITVAKNATPGPRDVWVTYTDGSGADDRTTMLEGGFTVQPSASTWYLAEGTTAWGFETYITIENPNDEALNARLSYLDQTPGSGTGKVSKTRDVALPALSQTTVDPGADIDGFDFSTKVECLEGKSIAVDRTMLWTGEGASSPEAHSSIGVTEPACSWLMPEGSSNHGFETWTTVQNPNGTAAELTITYMTEDFGAKQVKKTLSAHARGTYSMGKDIGAYDSSILVESDRPVIAERSMYRNDRREGSCSVGATAPAADFFLAEGSTAWGFSTYVCVQNPNDSEADVSLTYMTPDGAVSQEPFRMPANSRKTVLVNDAPGMWETDFSTVVRADKPVVAERAMYWDNGAGQACHASIGLDAAHQRFLLPDGQTTEGRETYTCVQNPNPIPVEVRVSYLPAGGDAPVTFTDILLSNSRKTYDMKDKGIKGRAAVMVESIMGGPVMVERAMYWSARGAGTVTIGGWSDFATPI